MVVQETVHKKWQLICLCALSQFKVFCDKICSGAVTIDELSSIKTQQIQVKKLCEVAIGSDKEKTESQDRVNFGIPSIDVFSHYLDLRFKEYHYFTGYIDHLSHFVRSLQSIEVFEGKLNSDSKEAAHFILCTQNEMFYRRNLMYTTTLFRLTQYVTLLTMAIVKLSLFQFLNWWKVVLNNLL